MNQSGAQASSSFLVRALSTALPSEQMVYGKPISTSIVRDPVSGPIHFGETGPENNRTAVHTEHVLAFGSERYDFWTRELGIEREAWPWAYWGENLTLDGLDETALHVGDIVQVGDVTFEVTGPRTPCFKLSWRLGQGMDFLRRLSASGYVGVYLRVKAPGHIRAGDKVSYTTTGKSNVSVAKIAQMIGELRAEDMDDACQVLRAEGFGDITRMLLANKVNHLEDVLRCQAHRWDGWRAFRIAEIQREGAGANAVSLVPEDGAPVAPFRAGQHVTVKLPTTPGIIRTWSLSAFAPYPDRYRITVKRASGSGSQWIADQARVGDIVELRAPGGRFVLDRASFFRVVLISAGVGITPVLSMLQAHALRGEHAPPLHWLHATEHAGTTIHSDEVDKILATMPSGVRQVHFAAPGAHDTPAQFDRSGRMSPTDLEAVVRTPYTVAGGKVTLPGEASHFYVCGPAGFMTMVTDALVALGIERGQIFSEQFAATPVVAGDSLAKPARVHFTRSDKTVDWNPAENLTLLELAESVGIDAPFSCRSGACGSCESGLGDGELSYASPPAVPLLPARCLTCCARPASPLVCVDL